MAGRTSPGSPRAGVPKSTRSTSPARIGYIAGRGVEHRTIVKIERRARQLKSDDATALAPNEEIELSVEREAITLGQLPERVAGPSRDLDGSHFWHTTYSTVLDHLSIERTTNV